MHESAPNFLFIITDQHRADHLGCYGNKVLRTPHIDALAARGIAFDRCYVAAPVCMPNRASLMTGRMPSVNGSRSNGIPLALEAVTVTQLLREAGYRTALIGKSHLQNLEDLPAMIAREEFAGLRQLPGFDEAKWTGIRGPQYEQELQSRWCDPSHRLRLPYYGFDHVELCNHHGDLTFGDWSRWAAQQQPGFERLCGADNAIPDPRFTAPQAWRTRLPEELYSTSYIAQRSIAYLDEHARTGNDQPFFLQCSFPDPHHPFTPPGRYWGMYDPADVEPPKTCRAPAEDAPAHVRWLHAEQAQLAGNTPRGFSPRMFAVGEREAREIIALTYGMIGMIDDAVAAILAALERTGLAANTVVVFTSDHGDLMGDHGLMLKGAIHYQSLIRVPCIWAEPGEAAGRRTDVLASSIDLAPTILMRAGIAPYNGMQGRNLLAAIDSASEQRDVQSVLIEEDNQRAYLGFDRPVRARTLVTERYRLTLYEGADWGEIYDLREDPDEERNLWAAPGCADLRADLLALMAHKLIEMCERSPLPTHRA